MSLADGSRVGYSKLLLATGSSPRRLSVPGADLDGVLYLRSVGDSDQIKAALRGASRVAVIGGGWIGLETAAAARAADVEPDGYDEVVFRSDAGQREFIAFWLGAGGRSAAR